MNVFLKNKRLKKSLYTTISTVLNYFKSSVLNLLTL